MSQIVSSHSVCMWVPLKWPYRGHCRTFKQFLMWSLWRKGTTVTTAPVSLLHFYHGSSVAKRKRSDIISFIPAHLLHFQTDFCELFNSCCAYCKQALLPVLLTQRRCEAPLQVCAQSGTPMITPSAGQLWLLLNACLSRCTWFEVSERTGKMKRGEVCAPWAKTEC